MFNMRILSVDFFHCDFRYNTNYIFLITVITNKANNG